MDLKNYKLAELKIHQVNFVHYFNSNSTWICWIVYYSVLLIVVITQSDAVYGSQKKWWLKSSADTGSLHPDENISERITKSPFSRTSASYEIAPSYGDVIYSRKDEFDTGK